MARPGESGLKGALGIAALALALSAPLVLLPAAAVEPGEAVVASLPNGRLAGYAPAVVVLPSRALVHVNADVSAHDVVAYADEAPGDRPWCREAATITGGCPLFWSPVIELGQEAAVRGLEDAEPGRLYRFYCTLHPGMQGQLVIVGD